MNSCLLLLRFLLWAWRALNAVLVGLQHLQEQIGSPSLGQTVAWIQIRRAPPAGCFTVVSRSPISSRSYCATALISISSLLSWHSVKVSAFKRLTNDRQPELLSCSQGISPSLSTKRALTPSPVSWLLCMEHASACNVALYCYTRA